MSLVTVLRPAAALVALGLAAAAHADLKIVEKTTMDMSKAQFFGKPITSAQLEQMKKLPMFGADGFTLTIYESGKKVKVDSPMMSSIVDQDAKTATMLIAPRKQYMVMPLPTPDAVKPKDNSVTADVVDLNQTKTILGHEAHLYKIAIKSKEMSFSGTAWMAPDMPELPEQAATNPAMNLMRGNVKGFPLKLNASITTPLFGTVGLSYDTKSIATDAIPASVFEIPAGYTKRERPTKTPVTPPKQ